MPAMQPEKLFPASKNAALLSVTSTVFWLAMTALLTMKNGLPR